MPKDFHNSLLERREPAARFTYMKFAGRHYIICNFMADDDALVVETLIEAMRSNQGLLAMKEGEDYQWEGASMISFKQKSHAALFYLCCPT